MVRIVAHQTQGLPGYGHAAPHLGAYRNIFQIGPENIGQETAVLVRPVIANRLSHKTCTHSNPDFFIHSVLLMDRYASLKSYPD
jgi:hypothetical protein